MSRPTVERLLTRWLSSQVDNVAIFPIFLQRFQIILAISKIFLPHKMYGFANEAQVDFYFRFRGLLGVDSLEECEKMSKKHVRTKLTQMLDHCNRSLR